MTKLGKYLTIIGMMGLSFVLMSCATVEENQRLEEQVQSKEARIETLQNELDQVRSERDELQEQVEQTEQNEQTISRLREELDRMQDQLGDIEEVEVVREEEILTVRVGAHVLFDTLKADLREDALQTLREIANVVEQHREREIRFEGHADNRPIIASPEFENNRELAAARALSVLQWFEENSDIPSERMASTSYGEYRPLAPNNSPENMQLNRRVEIVLYPPELPEEEIQS